MINNGASVAIREYGQVNLQQVVDGASPHRLVQMMMERALAKIAMARGQMERSAIAEKGKSIGDAIGIINGLQVSLNHKVDSDLSGNFDALYDYMARRLLEGNIKNDDQMLREVADLLRQVKEAWDAIGDEVGNAQVSGSGA